MSRICADTIWRDINARMPIVKDNSAIYIVTSVNDTAIIGVLVEVVVCLRFHQNK